VPHRLFIERQSNALESLNCAIPNLLASAPSQSELAVIVDRGLFTPDEDERLQYWFAKFLTVRRNLWSVVEACIDYAGGMDSLSEQHDYQVFVLGYSAVCSLMRIDRFLVTKIASHTIIQRKLNEPFPDHRIERKQFSDIVKAMVQPSNAIRIHQAHRILRKRRAKISQAVAESTVEQVFKKLPKQERYLNLSWRQYFKIWLSARKLSWKRRGASAKQKSIFTVLEYSGRLASELALPRPKKVTEAVRTQVQALLKPGDIFITRHSHALTNLFLPGFWPHAALYIGCDSDRRDSIEASTKNIKQWSGPNCTLEALKDGVHFRPLEETLNVDAFVIIRPNFSASDIAKAISRVCKHVGKGYNFDFDFFRSDQLVCTEVIYRAFDGINDSFIPLKERMGRKTLSAEDLLDLSIDTSWAKPIAIFGVGDSEEALLTDDQVIPILWQSYR